MSVSIREVADRAGVSVGTVSNVLNHREKVAPESIRRVNEAIAELGYVRNDAARQLRAGRSLSVGLVVLDVRNPFFTELARGAETEADRHGLSVILGNSDEDSRREARYLDLFEQQRVRGVLVSPYGEVADRLRLLRDRGLAVVLVDRLSEDTSFSSVSVDDEAGGALAARHLLERGARRLLFVGGPQGIPQVADRLRGARAAVAEVADAHLEEIATPAAHVADGLAVARLLAERPAHERPDAIFAANDLIALGVLQAFTGAGIRVPEDVALIGFDDIAFAAAAAVPLSSVRQPALLMGETAMRILLAEAEDPAREREHVVFPPELVERTSTGG